MKLNMLFARARSRALGRFARALRQSAAVPLRLVCLLAALSACDGESSDQGDAGETREEDESRASDAGGKASGQADEAGTASADDASSAGSGGGKSDGGANGGGSDAGSTRGDAGGTTGGDGGVTKDAGTTSKDAGPPGRTCGGFAGLECGANQFCNYEPPRGQGCDGQIADAAGVCEALPEVCTDQSDPVCGCDNRTYSNSCEAHHAGVSVAKKGACATKGTSCDRRALTCRRAEPVCPAGQVAAIVGNCFGDCVAIEQCACSEADACPQPEQYTCHRSAMHCGPYVN
jgi:hypothetical protein